GCDPRERGEERGAPRLSGTEGGRGEEAGLAEHSRGDLLEHLLVPLVYGEARVPAGSLQSPGSEEEGHHPGAAQGAVEEAARKAGFEGEMPSRKRVTAGGEQHHRRGGERLPPQEAG